MGQLTVFTAKRFYTMEPDLSVATAVGVLDGRIAGVGSLADLQPWMDAHECVVDDTFADRIVLPGFIDPHFHPFLPAVLTQMPFIAPDTWSLPTGDFPGATTPDAYWTMLQARFAQHDPADGPFFTWGYQPLFHGGIARADLDARLSSEVPIVLWHRSFHELFFNSAALSWAGISGPQDIAAPPDSLACINLDRGHFWEAGLLAVMPAVQGRFMAPERVFAGLTGVAAMAHGAGLTTLADMATGIFTAPEVEAAVLKQAFDQPETPFRLLLTPVETAFISEGLTPQQALVRVEALEKTSGEKVFFDKHIKLTADGAFYSLAFQVAAPGYIDGHPGEWIVDPEVSTAMAEVFWNAGYQLHVHVNGDQGVDFCLDMLEKLFEGHPRLDHRFTFEHLGYCTEDQVRRLEVLGGQVSGQPYYVHMLGDKYAEQGLGPDRAQAISRFGSVATRGIPLALHSDCPMAPLDPLRLVWTAVNRQTLSGRTSGPAQRLTVEQALRAITIDAAWILRLEGDLGSIRTGKKADFTVLAEDPFEVDSSALDDIGIVATVFEGSVRPV